MERVFLCKVILSNSLKSLKFDIYILNYNCICYFIFIFFVKIFVSYKIFYTFVEEI